MPRFHVVLRGVVLGLGALAFLFPFYYMVIGSLQREPDQSVAGAFPVPGNLTGANYLAINSRIDLLQGVINSGIFGDLSQDVVTYNFGSAPDENTTDVYIIDVIGGHCGGNPGPNWHDVTEDTRRGGTIGRWTLRPLLPYLQ